MALLPDTLTQAVADTAIKAVLREWVSQGHRLSGSFEREINYKLVKKARSIDIEVYFNHYGAIVNQGVPAARIPFSRGSGGRRSKYIQGLTRYAVQRFRVSRKEAERIAFAIATKHKKEGMPTRSSREFSQTGKRTGFVDAGLEVAEPKIDTLISDAVEESFNALIVNFFNDILKR